MPTLAEPASSQESDDNAHTTAWSSPENIILTDEAFTSSFRYVAEYGRSYSTRGDIYTLPADIEEIERLGTCFLCLMGVTLCHPHRV